MALKNNSFIENPIFILSSPRSGSTLLRLILNTHSKIYIPNEFPLIEKVIDKFNQIKEIPTQNAIQFIKGLSNHAHYKDWNINQTELINEIKNYSVLSKNELIQLIYIQYKKNNFNEKLIWGDKNIHSLSYIKEIITVFPKAKFLHIVRDGRDISISLKKVSWLFYKFPTKKRHYLNNVKGRALTWNDALDLIEENQSLFNQGNYFEIKYEELIKEPKVTITKICNYLNINFENDMLNFYKKDTTISKKRIKITHENTKKAILKNNSKKYLNEMTKKDLQIFENLSSKYLLKYNYGINEKVKSNFLNNIIYYISSNSMYLIFKIKKTLFN